MPPRETRYCRPRSDPPESFVEHLVRKYSYGTREEWEEHLAAGTIWIERGRRPNAPRLKKDRVAHSNDNSGAAPPSESHLFRVDATDAVKVIVMKHDPHLVLLQGDVIVFNPPKSVEPPVDAENITVIYVDDNVLCCVKNGAIPVSEGGRYSHNTLAAVLAERPLAQVTAEAAARLGGAVLAPNALSRHIIAGANNDALPTVQDASLQKRPREDAAHDGAVGTLFPVHRLDRETSGIVIMARHKAAAAALAVQFHHEESDASTIDCGAACGGDDRDGNPHDAEAVKVYHALVEGVITSEWLLKARADNNAHGVSIREHSSGGDALMMCVVIEAFVGPVLAAPQDIPEGQAKLAKLRMRCFPSPRAVSASPEGEASSSSQGAEPHNFGPGVKYAKTELIVLSTSERLNLSFVQCRIFTGRTHQIRLHCAHIGFPVLGDKMYSTTTPRAVGGGCAVDDDCYLRRVRGEEEFLWRCGGGHDKTTPPFGIVVSRHMLHACQLSCVVPSSAQSSPMPMLFREPATQWFLRDLTIRGEAVDGVESELRLLLASS